MRSARGPIHSPSSKADDQQTGHRIDPPRCRFGCGWRLRPAAPPARCVRAASAPSPSSLPTIAAVEKHLVRRRGTVSTTYSSTAACRSRRCRSRPAVEQCQQAVESSENHAGQDDGWHHRLEHQQIQARHGLMPSCASACRRAMPPAAVRPQAMNTTATDAACTQAEPHRVPDTAHTRASSTIGVGQIKQNGHHHLIEAAGCRGALWAMIGASISK